MKLPWPSKLGRLQQTFGATEHDPRKRKSAYRVAQRGFVRQHCTQYREKARTMVISSKTSLYWSFQTTSFFAESDQCHSSYSCWACSRIPKTFCHSLVSYSKAAGAPARVPSTLRYVFAPEAPVWFSPSPPVDSWLVPSRGAAEPSIEG